MNADAQALHREGVALERAGLLDEAEAAFRAALALAPASDPTARLLGVLLLSRGRYAEGFGFFEARHALSNMAKPDLPFPEWRGEPVAGCKLLIWPEQGYGDQIQFARFAPVLKAMGAEVTVLCRPALAALFERSLGVRVVAAEGRVDFPDPDYWTMAGSLAARLAVTPQTIPGEPYLFAAAAQRRPEGRFAVGLMTAGNPAHANDANRSLGAEDAERLLGLDAAVVPLDPARSGAADFAATADIVAGLDLVVSVDTAVAHLAGAMGKPCWTLIPKTSTDWRWGREGERTPWYPAMHLYRQTEPGRWNRELDRIVRDLAQLKGPG